MRRFLPGTLVAVACVGGAHATTAWDESASGDFSNAGASPPVVSLLEGANLVRGATGRSGGVVDRDCCRFTIPEGWQLDTLNVLPGTRFVSESNSGFIGVQAGQQFTVNPTGGSAAGLLEWVRYPEHVDREFALRPGVQRERGAGGLGPRHVLLTVELRSERKQAA